jgi:GNAT superfamily N-acetyltransferase
VNPGSPVDGLNPELDAVLLSRIEDAGLNASAPPQQRWVDGWLVRFSPGKAKRARCINAVADGRLPLADRLLACAEVFDQARLPLIVRLTPFSQPAGLDASLDTAGLRRFDDTRVMALPQLPVAPPPALPADTRLLSLGLEAFAQRVGAFRDSPLAQRQAHAQRLANSPVPYFAFELRHDGHAIACGQFALEGELAGLYDIYTIPEARGQGWAGLLCRHLIAQAALRGARQAYLQVEGDNHPARAVYRRIGFVDGYAYHYRTRDPAAA